MALEKSISIEAELQSICTENEDKKPPSNLSLCQKVKLVATNITVEPTLACYILPCVMAGLAMQNLSLEKACRVNLKFDPAICDAITIRNTSGYNQTDEETIHKYVASVIKYKNLVQSIIPSFLLLFVGSWSDRHRRRKPCMMLPILGEVVTISGLLICTYFFYELPLEVNVFFEAVPPAFLGGWFVMFMGLFSFITSITSAETRTLRIGAVNVFVNISITIGMALSGILFSVMGFYGIFILSLALYCIGIMYIWIVVKEVPSKEDIIEKECVKRNPVLDFFDWKHVRDTFVTVFKNDKRNQRKRVIAVMGLAVIILGPVHGEMNTAYMFVRHKFHWNEINYSLYTTFHFVVHFFGTVFSLWFFSKKLKWDDTMLGIISCASKVLACAVYAFAPTPTYFYVGAVVEILNGTSFIALRSIVSKLVSSNEIGKINSLFGLFEAFAPALYGPLYSVIYQTTIETFPGAFYLVGGALTAPAIVVFYWLYRQNVLDKKDAADKVPEGEGLLKRDEKANGLHVEKVS